MIVKKKILGIFCHPDDEILAGWPVFQSNMFEKHLITTCSDVQRRGSVRSNALLEVCNQEEIWLESCLCVDNNFYSLPTRRANYLLTDAIREIELTISSVINKIKPDYIFTHNVVGEYGHGSHRLLFEIVSQHPRVKNLIITDLCQKSNHRSSEEIPQSVRKAYYKNPIFPGYNNDIPGPLKLNKKFYIRCKAIYDKYNAWTWSFPPLETCNLFILNEDTGDGRK